jgi:hypothetical protein
MHCEAIREMDRLRGGELLLIKRIPCCKFKIGLCEDEDISTCSVRNKERHHRQREHISDITPTSEGVLSVLP